VIVSAGSATERRIYVATSGTESAFSVSADGGASFNQSSLIDTKLSSLIDFAPPPAGDTAMFLITANSDTAKRSLWRSLDGGRWERVASSALPGMDALQKVKAVPGALFVAGLSGTSPVIWQSSNAGQTFSVHPMPRAVDAWAFADRSTFFVAGYDGSNAIVHRTTNGGAFFSDGVPSGTRSATSLELSPAYAADHTLLLGNSYGEVLISSDDGRSFSPLGQQLPVAAGNTDVSVAFDPDYPHNGTAYAAVQTKATSTSKDRLFRLSMDRKTWQSALSSTPVDAAIARILTNDRGVLYALNTQAVAAADGKGGLLRCLSPLITPNPSFEYVARGLNDGHRLQGLWASQERLWSFETTTTRLMTFQDSLSAPPPLKSPADSATGLVTDVRLEWQAMTGATEYEWQVSDETDFSSLPAGFSGTANAASARVAALQPSTAYHWRVRVSKPCLSPWSAAWGFTTILGGANITAELVVPQAGATTSIRPVFQWRPVAGATRYELLVSNDASFVQPAVSRTGDLALPANAWQCDTDLEPGTAYFWRVRAVSDGNYGDWSAVSTFTTEKASSHQPVDGTGLLPSSPTTPAVQPVTFIKTETAAPTAPATTTVQVPFPRELLYGGIALMGMIVILVGVIVVMAFRRRN
jgi:hypothetical protein